MSYDPSKIEYHYPFNLTYQFNLKVESFTCPRCTFTTIQLPHLHDHLSQHSRPLPDKTRALQLPPVKWTGVLKETNGVIHEGS